MKKIYLLVLTIFVLLMGCKNDNKESTSHEETVVSINEENKEQKRLTIFFIDISGSFNKKRQYGVEKEVNFFNKACYETIKHIRVKSQIGEDYIVVKKIESFSFNDNATVTQLDLTSEKFCYPKETPKTDNDIIINNHIKAKSAFEKNAIVVAKEEKERAVGDVQDFQNHYTNKSSNYTDIIDALNAIKIDFDNSNFAEYEKRIIIYSDFKETKSKIKQGLSIDLSDYHIEGRYVSKDDFSSPSEYLDNIQLWKEVLKCKSLEFFSPDNNNYKF